jgi:hypothetical protein
MNGKERKAMQTIGGKVRTATQQGELPPVARHPLARLTMGCLLGVCMAALAACAPTPPRFGNFGGPMVELPATPAPPKQTYGPAHETDWSPVQARFHPDGNRLVIHFCHVDTPYYCRLVEYDRARNTWRRLPGQQEGVSYTYPSYSNDGKWLVFSIVPCSPDRKQCNSGYGQLATMPAEGGPIRLLPVQQARRAHFTADDQRLTYWRLKTSGKLASGRSFGSFSIYEFDLASGDEKPLVDSMESGPNRPYGVRFIADISAPRYTLDGKTLFFCALNDDTTLRDSKTQQVLLHPIPGWGRNCFLYDVATRDYKLINTDRMGRTQSNIGTPYVQHKTRGFLTGSYLGFVDATTLASIGSRFFDTRPISRTDADVDPQGVTVIAITGTTMFKNGEHALISTYYNMQQIDAFKSFKDPTNYKRASPVLTLINVNTHQTTPLEWPDIAQLSETRQP